MHTKVKCCKKLSVFVFLICNVQNTLCKNLSSLSYISVNHCYFNESFMGNNFSSLLLNENSYAKYLDLPKHLLLPTYANTTADVIRFGLETPSNDVACKTTKGEVDISLQLSVRLNANDRNEENKALDKKFTPDGYFKFGADYFSPEEYCIKSLQEEIITISLCLPDCDRNRPCVTRCCEFGEVFGFPGTLKCVSTGDEHWTPTVYKAPNIKLSENETKGLKFHFISRHPKTWCDHKPTISSLIDFEYFEKSLFRVLEDGTVVRKDNRRRKWKTLSDGTYCIEGIQFIPGVQQDFSGYENQTIIFDCEKPTEGKQSSLSIVYGVAQVIACVFLLLTVIVYGLLWDKQNIHGWTILGHVTSILCFYILLITTYFYTYFFNEYLSQTSETPSLCKHLAVATHFFFLSNFTWMSVINYDLYSTFKNLKPTAGNSKRKRRFLIYALFAFGLPALVVSIGIILDSLYGDDIESEVVVPQYGKFKCFLDSENAALPYLYGPIGFLLICNLLFFMITVYNLYKIQQVTKIATNNSSQRQSQRHKQKTKIFLKIFLVVGLTWISEVITWAWLGNSNDTYFAVVILDYINILQPIAIFIIFVCKADICNSLRQKYQIIDRTATSLYIDPLIADRIVHRCPKLERVIGPITRKGGDSRRRCMSTITELTNLSLRQTSSGQVQQLQ